MSRLEQVLGRWVEEQAQLGNPKAPRTIAELNLLGPVRDWTSAKIRSVVIGDLVRLALSEARPQGMLCMDGIWRLTDLEHMQCRRLINEVLGELCWGVLIDVISEMPTNEEGQPTGEVRLAICFAFLDPELRKQLGLTPLSGRPHAQA